MRVAYLKQAMRDRRIEHGHHIRRYSQNMPEVRDWR